jgi:hypothetical protein
MPNCNEISNNWILSTCRRYSHNLQPKEKKDETLTEFNKQQTNIKLTAEKEQHNSTDLLDLAIP